MEVPWRDGRFYLWKREKQGSDAALAKYLFARISTPHEKAAACGSFKAAGLMRRPE